MTLDDKRLAALISRFKDLTYFDEHTQRDFADTVKQGNILVNSEGHVLAWCAYTPDASFAPDNLLQLGHPSVFSEGRLLLAGTGLLKGPYASDIAYVVINPEDVSEIGTRFDTNRETWSIEVVAWQVRATKAKMIAYVDSNRVLHRADDLAEFGPVLAQWQLTQEPVSPPQ